MRTIITALALALATGSCAFAEPQRLDAGGIAVDVETIADGLAHPWGLEFLPRGGAIVTERPGRIRLISAEGELSQPLAGVPKVAAVGEGGLMDIELARDFAQSGTVFFAYTEPGEGGVGTTVARARLVEDGGKPRLEEVTTILQVAKGGGRTHFGSRILAMPDGTLFVTTGDQGMRDRSQKMDDAAGAVIRINADGSVPADNPSADGSLWLPEIWSKGHRNAQGLAYDPVTQGILTVEHGAKGGDEVNRPEAGRNYGWPVVTYGVDYSGAKIGIGTAAPGYEEPLFYWDPSIAPSGLAVYEGGMFPEWQGDLLVGALKMQLVSRLERDDTGRIVGEHRMLQRELGRIRDVKVAADGSIWLLTDEDSGKVLRVSRGG